MVSSAFYWHEMECEVMERKLDWSFKGKLEDARDEFMNFVENKRRTENYAHSVTDCSQMCKERGNRYKLTYIGLNLQPLSLRIINNGLRFNTPFPCISEGFIS